MERPRIPRGPVSHAFKIGAIAAAVRFLLICLHFLPTAVYVSCKKRHISSLLTQFMYHMRGIIFVSHLQTWDLSRNLHDRIFGPKIAWLSLCFIQETCWVALYSVVCLSGIGDTWPNIDFFQYIRHTSPLLTLYHLISSSTNFILTKYQPVLSYTDPIPSSTTYNSSSRKAQFSQLNNFSFYD